MKVIFLAAKNELYKLYGRGRVRAGMLVMGILCLLGALFALLVKSVVGYRISMDNYAVGFLPVLVEAILPITMLYQAARLFAWETESGVIRASLMQPVSRWQLFWGKFLALLASGALMLGAAFVFCTLLQLCFGFGFSIRNFLYGLLSYVVSLLPLACATLLGVLLAQIFHGAGGAVTIGILIFLFLIALGILVPPTQHFLFTSYMNWSCQFLGRMSWAGVQTILRTTALLLSYCAVFFSFSYARFATRDF